MDIEKIRVGFGLSQEAFAQQFRFSVAAVREGEQRRRKPETAARTLPQVIAYTPQVVTEALDASSLGSLGPVRLKLPAGGRL